MPLQAVFYLFFGSLPFMLYLVALIYYLLFYLLAGYRKHIKRFFKSIFVKLASSVLWFDHFGPSALVEILVRLRVAH